MDLHPAANVGKDRAVIAAMVADRRATYLGLEGADVARLHCGLVSDGTEQRVAVSPHLMSLHSTPLIDLWEVPGEALPLLSLPLAERRPLRRVPLREQ